MGGEEPFLNFTSNSLFLGQVKYQPVGQGDDIFARGRMELQLYVLCRFNRLLCLCNFEFVYLDWRGRHGESARNWSLSVMEPNKSPTMSSFCNADGGVSGRGMARFLSFSLVAFTDMTRATLFVFGSFFLGTFFRSSPKKPLLLRIPVRTHWLSLESLCWALTRFWAENFCLYMRAIDTLVLMDG
jgi:hypothetical protein